MEAILAFFPLEVIADNSRSAWFLDEDRARLPAGGGGGKLAGGEVAGELPCRACMTKRGDLRPYCRGDNPCIDIAVAAPTGVPLREQSAPGDTVSDGEGVVLFRAEA